jgi:glucose/mannose-6-phosphate isomerase
MNLDDVKAVNKVDRSQTLAVMQMTPERLTPPPDAVSTCGEHIGRPANIVFGGVGGSGIIGDIVNDYLRETGDVPASVCRSMRLPAYVGKNTLFVAISYSGQTPETLSLLDQAMRKGAMTVAVGSGGRLLDKSRQDRIGYLKVTEGLLPRLALPELLAAVIFLIGKTGLIGDTGKLLRDSAETLRDQIRKIGSSSLLQENEAKQMAQALLGRLPLLFGSEEFGSVLRRFKNELNENSKMPAFCYTLPEAYHDDVEGLNMLGKLAHPLPIVLIDQDENDSQRRTRERLYGLFADLGFQPVLEFKGKGDERLQRLLTAVMFGDYVSAYLAVLREVDPSELTLIPRFREAMRGP